jgi:TRAP-type mannitol/chloroaromatic compound transport system permease small subunit
MSDAPAAQSRYRIPVAQMLNAWVRRVAETTAWLNVLLIGVILAQVILRYGFHHGLVVLEELMWHLYAVASMFGIAYAVSNDSHIRVDLLHASLPQAARRLIEIFGILLLLMPFLWVVFDHSLQWVYDAYRLDEGSSSPQGLPHRWIIKAVIPLSFVLIFIAALARLISESLLLLHGEKAPEAPLPAQASKLRRLFQVLPASGEIDQGRG